MGQRPNTKQRKKNAQRQAKQIIAKQPDGIAKEGRRIYDLLNEDEVRQFLWIHMVLDPWGPATRMPLILGNGVWEEQLFRYHMYGTITANSVLAGFALLSQDEWTDSTSADQIMGYSVVGIPLWTTDATYVGNSSPSAGAAVGSGRLGIPLSSDTSYGGADPANTKHYVQTASAVRCRPISNADTTSGEVMVAWSKDTSNYPLTNVSFDDVQGYPQDVCIRKIVPMANWKPDQWLELASIPRERDAFSSTKAVANGSVVVSGSGSTLGVFTKGMTAGQSVEVEGVAIYQVEEEGNNRVTDAYSATVVIPGHHVGNSPNRRGVMSGERAEALAYHAGESIGARLAPASQLGSPHMRNPRSVGAAKALARAEPNLPQRAKQQGWLSRAWSGVKDYAKKNWASILMKGIEAASFLI